MTEIISLFSIIILGYGLGDLKIKKISLGSSGVLIVALIFGHFGFSLPKSVSDLGLAIFTSTIGFIAGPEFVKNFRAKAVQFVIIGLSTTLIGSAMCCFFIKNMDVPTHLAVGMMTGALTSTPGLAAAVEATGDSVASVGYGIAYPFGVIGVVLFVQIMCRIRQVGASADDIDDTKIKVKAVPVPDILKISCAILLGQLIAKLSIPLPGGNSFSFGSSGGPMLAGLLMGSIGGVGKISFTPSKDSVSILRELGMILFLSYTGVQAGSGFVEVVKQYGLLLFFYGALMTLTPMLLVYWAGVKLFKLSRVTALSAVCGGMTSTPALGTLLNVAEDKSSAAAGYAATYPVALVTVVIASQLVSLIH